MAAQARWEEIHGVQHSYYCGAYWANGFHEDGVVSALRVAAKAHEELYAAIRDEGWTQGMVERMQTRAELYATIQRIGDEIEKAPHGRLRGGEPQHGAGPGAGHAKDVRQDRAAQAR